MSNWTQTLEAWRSLPIQQIKPSQLKMDPALQPRTEQALGFLHRDKARNESANHISALADRLDACSDLDPVLAAKINGTLYVVDGHHRLSAYKRAKRPSIPAKILETDWEIAVIVSKIANLDNRALRLHRDQAREACWQYLATITEQGRIDPKKVTSCRKAAAMFNIGIDTVHRMLKRIPTIDPDDFNSVALDPGTGWPLWRYCKSNLDPFGPVPDRLKVEKQAAQLAKQLGKQEAEINEAALSLLLNQDRNEPVELPAVLQSLINRYSRDSVSDEYLEEAPEES